MDTIFVSYRRSDSQGEAGRLFDDLVRHLGENKVFMDVAAIEAGRDFRKAIDESVAKCGVLLVVIGQQWLNATDESGERRLDDPLDFVRIETASALRRDIPVIPVLVRGAEMPHAEQLPEDLRDLAYRNCIELTHARWKSDIQLLIDALRRLGGDASQIRASTSANEATASVRSVSPHRDVTGFESALGPVRDAMLRSSWLVRALILFSIVGAGLLWKTAQSIDWSLAPDMIVAWRHRGVLQLPTSESTKVDQAISKTLSPYLAGELNNAYSTPDKSTAWGVSQMAVALLGSKEADGKTVTALLDRMRYSNCHCWKVVSSEPVPDMASLNWVAFALAKLGQKLPSADLAIILNNEHDGWWPAFSSATDNEINASTYATAWSVLALNEQMRLGIEEPQLSEVQAKIDRGKCWLLNKKMSGKARWLDYPNAVGTVGKETIGISGLVVHVLHRLGAETREIDAEWMRDLPADIPKPSDWDANPVFVAMPNTSWVQDNTRQLRLPWTIIATVDAYQNGALRDQARANKWFRQFTDQIGPEVGTLMSNLSWAAAEVTIALRYLGRKQHAGAEVV